MSVMIHEGGYMMRTEDPSTYPEGPLVSSCHGHPCDRGYRSGAGLAGSIGRWLLLIVARVLIHLDLGLLVLTLVLIRRITLLLANGFSGVACLPLISTVQAIALVPYQYKDQRYRPTKENE
jgi:hypothetical protein